MALLKVFLVVLVLLAIAFLALSVRIVFRKGGKFPNLHIGSNKHMKARGISCAQSYDKAEQARARKEMTFKDLTLSDPEK